MTDDGAGGAGPLRYWWLIIVIGAVVVVAIIWMSVRVGGAPDEAEGTSTPGGVATESSSTADEEAAEAGTGATAPTGSPGADEVTPTPGQTEPVEKPSPSREVPFEEPETVDDSIVVEVLSVEAVTAGRDIPGEISGPAVQVRIRVSNEGSQAVDTSGATVNMTYGDDDRIPAVELTDDASTTLPLSIAPGEVAEATYLFSAPLEDAGNVRIMVDVLASEPDAVFFGPRP